MNWQPGDKVIVAPQGTQAQRWRGAEGVICRQGMVKFQIMPNCWWFWCPHAAGELLLTASEILTHEEWAGIVLSS